MVPHVARRKDIGRAQFLTRHSGRHIEAGLRLSTNGLQRKGVVGAADHRIGARSDADRGVTLHATVIAGESINFQGGIDWLRENGVDVIDLHSAECIELLAAYIRGNPAIWNEDIGVD